MVWRDLRFDLILTFVLDLPTLDLCCDSLEMAKRMPTAAMRIMREEPPWEMKGRGTPVMGAMETLTAMLRADWTAIQVVMPVARRKPNLSGELKAVLKPLQMRAKRARRMAEILRKPSSSAATAMMESAWGSGR